jgi:hypothetical protein
MYMSAPHNLNVSMYSLEEILGLFNLSYDIDLEGIKRAKKKVLMSHPDKSRLPSEYFIFYKRAFEVVVQFYEEQTRHNRKPTNEPMQYSNMNVVDKNVKRTINEMKTKDFQKKFNEIFEQNMTTKPDPNRNEWFRKDEPLYNDLGNVSAQNMGRAFDTIKSKNALSIRNSGIQTLGGGGTNLYDEDDDDKYVTCDPFSKLKFDDLRKVHKDQTILAVSEKDYDTMRKYSSMDNLMQERGRDKLTPLESSEAEKMIETRQKERERIIMRKQYEASLKTSEYEKKNSSVLSNFLRLGN